MKFVAEQLTNYKRPKIIEFRDELPKTPVGKILRRALRDEKREAEGGVDLRHVRPSRASTRFARRAPGARRRTGRMLNHS